MALYLLLSSIPFSNCNNYLLFIYIRTSNQKIAVYQTNENKKRTSTKYAFFFSEILSVLVRTMCNFIHTETITWSLNEKFPIRKYAGSEHSDNV